MNERTFNQILAGLDPRPPGADEALLRRFVRLMDQEDTWITGHGLSAQGLTLTFSNDADTYTVGIDAMRKVLAMVDQGLPIPWRELPRDEDGEEAPQLPTPKKR
jgi:hypothetical protein